MDTQTISVKVGANAVDEMTDVPSASKFEGHVGAHTEKDVLVDGIGAKAVGC